MTQLQGACGRRPPDTPVLRQSRAAPKWQGVLRKPGASELMGSTSKVHSDDTDVIPDISRTQLFKLKVKYNENVSVAGALATFQELKSRTWLGVSTLDGSDTDHQGRESYRAQCYQILKPTLHSQ